MGKRKYLKIKYIPKVEKKKKVPFVSFFLLSILFLVVSFGVSYALLTQTLKGEKEQKITAGELAVSYKDKKVIHLSNTYPMSDERGMMLESYEFSVENTGDVKALYDISLEEDQSTMNYSYLKYSLKRNSEEWSEPKVLDSLKLRETIELEVGVKDSYELKLWVDESVGNEGQNKVFRARVVISSVQSNASSKDVTPPVIKLKGSLSESVEQNKEYVDAGVESIVDDKDTLNKEDIKVAYEYYDGENNKEVERIDTSKLGVYYITYTISDKSGNIGKIIRSVNIYKENTTPPVIRLNGSNLIAIKRGEEYSELGASASSGEVDLTNRVVTVGVVNTSRIGTYDIKYLITDNDGNTASIVRIVNVIHITSELKTDIKLDLTNKPTDKINLEGENLGDITYTSSAHDIVTVDSDGNVEGQNVGVTSVTITTSTGVEEIVKVHVEKTVTATFIKQSGASSIGEESATCTITEKNGSCPVVLLTITAKLGYNTGFWSEDSSATSGIEQGENVLLSEDSTYYAICLDTTKPIWSLVSVTPSSGTISASDSVEITFRGTDTSGSVISSLTVEDIIVKVGTTTINPTTKILSNEEDVENGKQYILTLSGLSSSGVISITIASSTLKDDSDNVNDETIFMSNVTLTIISNVTSSKNFKDHILSVANTTSNTDEASEAEKQQPFTIVHEAGEQQSGWTTEQLTDYRYIGATPYNYVTFNNEVWRIIGVFTVENEKGVKEQRVKIIRNSSILNGIVWDNTGYDGENDWSKSALQKVLNSGSYYNRVSGNYPSGKNGSTKSCDFSSSGLTEDAKGMIGKTKWYLGGASSAQTADNFYKLERGTTVYSDRPISWIGEVGLMYPSDYVYSMGSSGWLYFGYLEWMIMPDSSSAYRVFIYNIPGTVFLSQPSGFTPARSTHPCVYLNQNILVTSGNGSSGNPYQLSI